MKRLIPLALFSILFLAFSTKAQVNGSSGGGGPTKGDLRAICENLDFVTSNLEKNYLAEKGITYNSVKDFTNYLDLMMVNEAVKLIQYTQNGTPCKSVLSKSDLKKLIEIRDTWEIGSSTAKRYCLGKFTHRFHHLASLRTLISIYGSNEDQ